MRKDLLIIDTRNKYEIFIGSFKNSINPDTNSFREFPKKFKELKISKNRRIGMFCTGGIRCEKASAYLKARLQKCFSARWGYFKLSKNSKNNSEDQYWHGECFVFDDRVTVNKNLEKGKFYNAMDVECQLRLKTLNQTNI